MCTNGVKFRSATDYSEAQSPFLSQTDTAKRANKTALQLLRDVNFFFLIHMPQEVD
jgi:hypothetical protein